MSRVPYPLALLAAACLAGGNAAALSIGGVRSPVVLGQTLNLALPVDLGPGEVLEDGCVRVEVHVGESRLSPELVATSLERAADPSRLKVRVRTAAAIGEPVVGVTVSAGCPVRMTRHFVLFADPPEGLAATPAPIAAPVVADATTAAADAPPAAVQRSSTAAPVSAAAPAAAAAKRVRDAAAPARQAAAPRKAESRRVTAAAKPRPRLQLDLVEPLAPSAPAAPEVAAQVADAVAGAGAAAAAAEAAAAALREQAATTAAALDRLRSEAEADRAALRALRQRLDEAESRADWLPWMIAALASMTALLGVLGWRLRRAMKAPWWQAAEGAAVEAADADDAAAPHADPAGAEAPTTRPAVVLPPSAADAMPLPAPVEPTPAVARNTLRPTVAVVDPSLPEVTVDEQIDLEQHVEFFVVLGQDDEAVDLLRSHLRRTGGQSPMPYLKLLEIYRRTGDREAYERTRGRFERRFSAAAPDWDADPGAQRGFDDCPHLVADLQARWAKPLEAMVWLESLLFRRHDAAEVLDLATYADALLLYQLARDLHRSEAEDAALVDVLLPIEPAEAEASIIATLPAALQAGLDEPPRPAAIAATTARRDTDALAVAELR
jgi:hypothetical protein